MASVAATSRGPRQQPSNLKMRYRPVGVPRSESSSETSDPEPNRASQNDQVEFRIPKGFEDTGTPRKRKFADANGTGKHDTSNGRGKKPKHVDSREKDPSASQEFSMPEVTEDPASKVSPRDQDSRSNGQKHDHLTNGAGSGQKTEKSTERAERKKRKEEKRARKDEKRRKKEEKEQKQTLKLGDKRTAVDEHQMEEHHNPKQVVRLVEDDHNVIERSEDREKKKPTTQHSTGRKEKEKERKDQAERGEKKRAKLAKLAAKSSTNMANGGPTSDT